MRKQSHARTIERVKKSNKDYVLHMKRNGPAGRSRGRGIFTPSLAIEEEKENREEQWEVIEGKEKETILPKGGREEKAKDAVL